MSAMTSQVSFMEGFKKNKKKIMENSILGGEGGGVSKGHFPYSFFFIFFCSKWSKNHF